MEGNNFIRIGPFTEGLVEGINRYNYEDRPTFIEAMNVFIDRGMVRKAGPIVDTGFKMIDAVSKQPSGEPAICIYSFNAKLTGPSSFFIGPKSINYIDYTTQSLTAYDGYYSNESIDTVRHISACHWTTSLDELLFITNGEPLSNGLNGVRTIDIKTKQHSAFTPVVDSSSKLVLLGAKFVLSWSNRVFAFGVYEGTANGTPTFNSTRVRYSSNATGQPKAWQSWDSSKGEETAGFFTLGTGFSIDAIKLVNNEVIVFCGPDLYIISEARSGPKAFNVEQIGNYRSVFSEGSVSVMNDAGLAAGPEGIFIIETSVDKFQIQNADDKIKDFKYNGMHTQAAGSSFYTVNHKRRMNYLSYPSLVHGPIPDGSHKYPFINDRILTYDWDSNSYSDYELSATSIGPIIYPKGVYKSFASSDRNVMVCCKPDGSIHYFDELLVEGDSSFSLFIDDIKFTDPKVSMSRMEYAMFEFFSPFTSPQRVKVEFYCDRKVYSTKYFWTVPNEYIMLDVEDGAYQQIDTLLKSPRHGISTIEPQRMYVNFSDDISPLSFNGKEYLCERYDDDQILLGASIPTYQGRQFGSALLSFGRPIDVSKFPMSLRIKVLNGGVASTHGIRISSYRQQSLALCAIDCHMSVVSESEF